MLRENQRWKVNVSTKVNGSKEHEKLKVKGKMLKVNHENEKDKTEYRKMLKAHLSSLFMLCFMR